MNKLHPQFFKSTATSSPRSTQMKMPNEWWATANQNSDSFHRIKTFTFLASLRIPIALTTIPAQPVNLASTTNQKLSARKSRKKNAN